MGVWGEFGADEIEQSYLLYFEAGAASIPRERARVDEASERRTGGNI